MAKPRRSKIDTPTARASLPISKKPQYKSLEPGVFLGYRRGRAERRWVARLYDEAERKYTVEAVGYADDADVQPGGEPPMTYAQARDAVLALAAKKRAKVAAGPSVVTIRTAVGAYMKSRDARESARQGKPVKSDAHRLEKHVLCNETLAALPIDKLTDAETDELRDALAEWRAGLGGAVGTRQRTANDFRAALGEAKITAAVRLAISEGLKMPGKEEGEAAPRENQILTDEEVRRLIAAARSADDDGDLHRMVLILAATGARFSQVRRLRVADVQAKRLMIPASRKGRKRTTEKPPIPVPIGADVIDALQPAIRGRKGTEPLLLRWRHEQVERDEKTGRPVWQRKDRDAWTSASELTRPFTALATAAKLPGTIPYALRHSSIVRALRQNLPIRLVAALHDTSVAMIERHYGRWIADGLEELAARAIVPMIEESRDNVVPLHGGAA